ncbi:hypothetical protein K469DRAFT_755851 [Zopfia rhizophila CBS 207.26]|uniref:AA9 family lytic polysaccharide monooxygenase n=1 Tax=Zopfia rhizophila CBS 207.26 TaxID=1314779 RepID=A0A6A6D9U1_9PEZI|nr:hypothetical protein K469DRAFT_755851 [Zopfia rhizophila CBS 207.26]
MTYAATSAHPQPVLEPKPHLWSPAILSALDFTEVIFQRKIYPPRPREVYLSRTSGELETYKGDGEWFKIQEYGVGDAKDWGSNGNDEFMNFTIPKPTPPGKYLLWVEQNVSASSQIQHIIIVKPLNFSYLNAISLLIP